MKKMCLSIFLILFALSLSAENFDPAACPDLSVRIFPCSNRWSIMLVSASKYLHDGFGFDYAGCTTVGKPSKQRYRTLIHFEMASGKKSQLLYLVTISSHATKETDRFELAIDRPFFKGPEKVIPLKISRQDHGTAVFTSYLDSERRKPFRRLKINLTDSTAFFTYAPDQKYKITWDANGFSVTGLPKGYNRFDFDWSSLRMFRRMANGITVLSHKIGYRWGIFPVYEKFYLTRIELYFESETPDWIL